MDNESDHHWVGCFEFQFTSLFLTGCLWGRERWGFILITAFELRGYFSILYTSSPNFLFIHFWIESTGGLQASDACKFPWRLTALVKWRSLSCSRELAFLKHLEPRISKYNCQGYILLLSLLLGISGRWKVFNYYFTQRNCSIFEVYSGNTQFCDRYGRLWQDRKSQLHYFFDIANVKCEFDKCYLESR